MVCYKIIETHQGEIKINSTEDIGTRVEIRLPINLNSTGSHLNHNK